MSRSLPISRPNLAIGLAALVSLLALWLVPPVGFVAVLVLLVLVPPWGTSLAERAIISAVVVGGLAAVAFPRAGGTPVTEISSRLLLTVVVLGVLGLRLVPRLREARIPRPSLSDGLLVALGIASAGWLMSAYVGRTGSQIVSGLFFSGWDNQGHFTSFANTYSSASTTWPTVDGSIAWNQWYPSLHTTLWSLAELASSQSTLDRPGLLGPYVLWSALTFALCLVALAWVAGDLAARLGGRDRERWTRPLAVAGFAVFALLGSPTLLFNAGFTNFMMAVTVVVVTAYISARSLASARTLGWFLVPLGALCAIGLWTPLALGLVPSGVVVAVSLVRYRRVLGIAWVIAAAAVGVVLVLTQTAAILGVEPGQSTGDFAADLGAVGTGMVPFNLGIALLSPLIAGLLVVLVVRSGRWPLAVAVTGPIAGAAVVAAVFAVGADAAGTGRLESYYVLKPLDAMLLAVSPLIAAAAAVAVSRALAGASRAASALAVALAGIIAVGLFGYAGFLPEQVAAGFSAAPGVQAGADRMRGINDPLLGGALLGAQEAAAGFPEETTMLWDGSGVLPNLWVSSLHGVMSKAENRFYSNLPQFPYGDATLDYVDLSLNLNPALNLVMLWFRPSSGVLLAEYAARSKAGRVTSVQVPMDPSVLCPECAP